MPTDNSKSTDDGFKKHLEKKTFTHDESNCGAEDENPLQEIITLWVAIYLLSNEEIQTIANIKCLGKLKGLQTR